MRAISLSVTAPITLLGAVLVALSIGVARAQGSGDESHLRDLAGRSAGYTAEVRELLARGVNPNAPDSQGRTAVHAAARIGAAATLEALLQAYGDSDAQDTDGNTPLHLAADASSAVLSESDSIAAIRTLLGHQAKPNRANGNGETPLHLAARSHDRPGGVAALLSAGANPNRADRRGETPLHAALGPNRGISGIVGTLLDGGANPEAVNADGLTPLLLFVRHGPDRGDTVARLLRAGANPDRKDPDGEAPLHIAIRTGGNRGKVEVAEALLAGGADPCIRDGQGFIPYSVAAEGGPIHQALDRAGGYDRACGGRGDAIALDSSQRRRIQAALADAGFDPGPADGQFGPRTHRAIQAWQHANGYSPTGDLTGKQVEAILTETTSAAAALEPKCADLPGRYLDDNHAECWEKIESRPGCHWWNNHYHSDRTARWTGRCEGGFAEGRGTLSKSAGSEHDSAETSGTMSDGKRHGDWVLRFADGRVEEGSYIEGKRHGHWVWRSADGQVGEGPYVDGKRHGRWVRDDSDGTVSEGPYVDGKRHGYWVRRSASESGAEGPYVDGERHGHWVVRIRRTVSEGPYVNGKRHGHSLTHHADGRVVEKRCDNGVCETVE